jgi:hypothetical protein
MRSILSKHYKQQKLKTYNEQMIKQYVYEENRNTQNSIQSKISKQEESNIPRFTRKVIQINTMKKQTVIHNFIHYCLQYKIIMWNMNKHTLYCVISLNDCHIGRLINDRQLESSKMKIRAV